MREDSQHAEKSSAKILLKGSLKTKKGDRHLVTCKAKSLKFFRDPRHGIRRL